MASTHTDMNDPMVQKAYRAWRGILLRTGVSGNCARWHYKNMPVEPVWVISFEVFFADMGPAPSPEHSVDRIDNNKGYVRNNVRWATVEEQQNNRKSSRYLEFNGERMTLTQWSRRCGISAEALWKRLKTGWTVEEAITIPRYQDRSWLRLQKALGKIPS